MPTEQITQTKTCGHETPECCAICECCKASMCDDCAADTAPCDCCGGPICITCINLPGCGEGRSQMPNVRSRGGRDGSRDYMCHNCASQQDMAWHELRPILMARSHDSVGRGVWLADTISLLESALAAARKAL